MNPCRCGYYGITSRECARAPRCAQEYQSKISGPLLDRFDLIFYVPQLPIDDFISYGVSDQAESSDTIKQRVCGALEFRKRNEKSKKSAMVEDLDMSSQLFLKNLAEKKHLSARGCCRLMGVARTIADLAKSENIAQTHLCEAASYRYSLAGMA
jgi:magnesium chelatase family protein